MMLYCTLVLLTFIIEILLLFYLQFILLSFNSPPPRISSGEYIQMSGRAGRRGKDDRGVVIQMLDEKMEPDVAKDMIYGASDPLCRSGFLCTVIGSIMGMQFYGLLHILLCSFQVYLIHNIVFPFSSRCYVDSCVSFSSCHRCSSYHVTYNMVLNMLRVEDADPESLLRSSFHQYQQEQQAPSLEREAEEIQREAVLIPVEEEAIVADYYSWDSLKKKMRREISTVVMRPENCLPFLNSGRLVQVYTWGWGVLINHRKITGNVSAPPSDRSIGFETGVTNAEYIADVLLLTKLSEDGFVVFEPAVADEGALGAAAGADEAQSMEIIPVSLQAISDLSAIRLTLPKDLTKEAARKSVLKSLKEVKRRFEPKGGVPRLHPGERLIRTMCLISSPRSSLYCLSSPCVTVSVFYFFPSLFNAFNSGHIRHLFFYMNCNLAFFVTVNSLLVLVPPYIKYSNAESATNSSPPSHLYFLSFPSLYEVDDIGIGDVSFKALLDREQDLEKSLRDSPFNAAPDKAERFAAYCKRVELLEQARLYRQQARESQTVAMKEELRRRKRVLRRLGYISEEGVLGVKGRFSCELSTGDELVLTDMVFDGAFNDLTTEQCVALLSCFVHKEQQKDGDGGAKLPAAMQGPFRQLQTVARNVAKVSADAKLAYDEEDYVKSFNPGLVEVCFAWASGAKFVDICKLTDIFEGSIIRVIRRLEELLRQLASAALAIGNNELKKMFEEGADKIRRGVVFAASLYL